MLSASGRDIAVFLGPVCALMPSGTPEECEGSEVGGKRSRARLWDAGSGERYTPQLRQVTATGTGGFSGYELTGEPALGLNPLKSGFVLSSLPGKKHL